MFPKRIFRQMAAGLTASLLVFVMGGCGTSGKTVNEQRRHAEASRNDVRGDFQEFRARMPTTMWSGTAIAGYLPCGNGGINYLVQSSVVLYDNSAATADYLQELQHALESVGWRPISGGTSLDFRLKKGENEFRFKGFKGVSHANSWLYGTCMHVDRKVSSELQRQTKGHCEPTIRLKKMRSHSDLEGLCSWGRPS
jgi:hypothetical protein